MSFVLAGFALTAAQRASAQRPAGRDSREVQAVTNCRAPVTVTGAVFGPGRFILQRRVRLAEVLAAAGGLTERAGKTVEIKRAGLSGDCKNLATGEVKKKEERVEVYELAALLRDDNQADPDVSPGDQVFVSEFGTVTVMGNVAQPREILLKEPTTITRAIALAGGLVPESAPSRVRIMRGCDPRMEVIVVDLRAINRGLARDVVLQPFDIVFVPGKRVFVGPPLCRRLAPLARELPSRIIY